jgi:hypothetical protein
MCIAFFRAWQNQLWRVAEWLVLKANSELKVVADREAVVVLPAAAVAVENPEVGVARAVVVEVASQAAVVVDREAVSLVVAVADKAAAVKGAVVVDAPAAADRAVVDRVVVDRVEVDKVEVVVSPVAEGAADPLAAAVEWEAEARVVVVAVAVHPVVVAAAETAKPSDSGGASRICGAPLFFIDALRRRDGPVSAVDRAAHRHVPAASSVAFARQRKRDSTTRRASRVRDSSRTKRSA